MQQLQISEMNEPESLESTRIKFGRAQLRGLFLVKYAKLYYSMLYNVI